MLNSKSLTPAERVIPSWTDATARRASDLVGGPLGRHALIGRAPFFTPLRVALLLAIGVLILGWLVKSPCIQTGADGGLDQSGNRPWVSGCYNDTTTIYKGRGLDLGHFIYSRMFDGNGDAIRPIEYPVVTSLWLWGTGFLTNKYLEFTKATGIFPVPLDYGAFFTIGAILLGLMYLWAIASTFRMARRRPWDVLIMCLSPLLIVHAFTNWDLLALGLTAAAMAAWAGKRPTWAGVLIGLGIAAKLYPVLLLGPLLVLCFRSARMRPFFITAGAAAVTWLAINIPIALYNYDAWYEFIRLNSTRTSEYSTIYQIYTRWSGSRIFEPVLAADESPGLLNLVSLIAFALCCVAVAWFALSAKRRPRVAQLMFLLVAAFLLTNKVWSPQYSLWLLPLVVLALPKWRIVLIWQLVEAAVWYLLMPTFVTDSNGNREAILSYYPFQATVLIRDAIVIAMCVMVIRNVLKPETDLIRMAGDDDPTGGFLENTADVRTIPSLPDLWRRWRDSGPAAGSWAPPADPVESDQALVLTGQPTGEPGTRPV
ncbi:DUF2029 domain-containing protein [Nakamurella silvestris]|nr:DUF2029 domain-containing protein [Nakamurella silvestris]